MSALGLFNAISSTKKAFFSLLSFASTSSTGSLNYSPTPYTNELPSTASLVNQAAYGNTAIMPEVADDPKSPKIPRRVRISDEEEPKQVHFQSNGGTSSGGKLPSGAAPGSAKAAQDTQQKQHQQQQQPVNTQPTSFPQVGTAPNSAYGAGQWYTTADPSQSLNQFPYNGGQLFNTSWPGALPPGACYANGQPGAHFFAAPPHLVNPTVFPAFTASPYPFACVGLPPFLPSFLYPASGCLQRFHPPHPLYTCYPPLAAGQHTPWIDQRANTMASYRNSVPPPCGVNFQPPVPDTTFGPMPHVYVPRFDGGCDAGFQVGYPPMQFVSAAPACTTVLVPKTFYVNGYTYYASYSQRPSTVAGADDCVLYQVAESSDDFALSPITFPVLRLSQSLANVYSNPASEACSQTNPATSSRNSQP